MSVNPDATVEVTTSDGAGRAQVWWNHAPPLPGESIGTVGGFHATSARAAVEVLARACERLRAQGCTLAIGPMDGNTWRRYRLVTDAGTEPPFLFEPTNPPEWPAWWRAADFNSLAEYYSSATTGLGTRDPRLESVAMRLASGGVTIRSLELQRFEEELGRIFDVSIISFRQNFLYTPVTRPEFLAQYVPLQAKVRPELVLLAEQAGRPVGYVFAVPDYLQAQRGEPVTTLIVKTLAVLPGRSYAGLGALLLDRVHAAGQRLGFTRAIHALMHEANKSLNLSARSARVIRRYTLFARRLAEPAKIAGRDA